MTKYITDNIEIESQIIEEAKTYPPVTFLREIKKEKGGFETFGETKLVNHYLDQGIPKEVINMAIHYILVIMDNAVIHKNYLDALMISWSQSDLITAEMVMEFIKKNNRRIKKVKKKEEISAVVEKVEFDSKEDQEIAIKRQLDLLIKKGYLESYFFEKDSTVKLKY